MNKPLRMAFMGTPDFAISALKALIESRHQVVCVYTQPPRPKGRGQNVQESPVHLLAQSHGIEVRTPINFKSQDDVAAFQSLSLDVAIVAAYGLILPKVVLDAPTYGCINIHGSLLPRWRGAAPIQRAILEGDSETGITIMQMDEGLDTGDMIQKRSVAMTEKTTSVMLYDRLSVLGAEMIVDVMDMLSKEGALPKTPQTEMGATYAKMLKKDEGRIDWQKDTGFIDRQIRALNPWPGTWCETQTGKRLKILEATVAAPVMSGKSGEVLNAGCMIACGQGTTIQLKIVQPENKKPMTAVEAMHGGYITQGDILS